MNQFWMIIVYNSKNHQHTILLYCKYNWEDHLYKKGDRTVPCEAPESTGTEWLFWLSTTKYWDLICKKAWSQNKSAPWILWWHNLWHKWMWETLLNTLLKSNNRTSHWPPWLKHQFCKIINNRNKQTFTASN